MYHFIQPVQKVAHVTLYLGLNGLLYIYQRNLIFFHRIFKMTFTPAPRTKSQINKIKKVELVEILMMYQAELDKTKGDLALVTTKFENSKKIEYNWSTVTKQFRSLVKEQIAKETKMIWKDAKTIYNSLSFELINHPSK